MNVFNNKYDIIKTSRFKNTYDKINNINKQNIDAINNINSNFSNYINSLYTNYANIDNSNKFININNKSSLGSNNLNTQLISINNQSLDNLLSNENLINEYSNISSIINSLQSTDTNILQNSIDKLINNSVNSSSPNVNSDTIINDVSNNENNNADIENIKKWVSQSCEKYNMDSNLIMAIIKAESSFNQNAVSKSGAVGLMQLMPTTAKEMGLIVNGTMDERLDPQKNIDAGVKYLSKYHNKISNYFGMENWDLTIAGYNCGPNRVMREGKIPNITETQNYVKKVNKYWTEYKNK